MGADAVLARAQRLTRKGLAVLPCDPQTKAPLLRQGFLDASRDPAVLALWWERWPDALVGVATGEPSELRLVVLDHDTYKRDAATDAGMDALLAGAPRHRVHRTRSGGVHHLFTQPDEGPPVPTLSGARVDGRKLVGLDVRAAGGYVIWWPAHGEPIEGGPLAPLPRDIADRLGRVTSGVEPETRDDVVEALRARGLYKGQEAPGVHNVTCLWEAEHTTDTGPKSTQYREAHHGGFERAAWLCKHAHCEGVRSLRDARRLLGLPTLDDGPTHAELFGEPTAAPDDPATFAPTRLERVRALEAAWGPLDARATTDFAVERLLPIGEATILAAEGGTFKSTLAALLAVRVASGTPLGPLLVRHQGAVVYVTAEDRADLVMDRMKDAAEVAGLDVAALVPRLRVLDLSAPLPVVTMVGTESTIES